MAPQVWVWREHRVKQLKSFLDHVLLLFPFEKKYFDKEGIKSTFTGHPLLEEQSKSKVDISQIIKDNKKFFSIYPGSRLSEINVLTPILFEFIKQMNYRTFLFQKAYTKALDSGLKETDEAFEKGVFGAPTFLVNNKIFWGQDRLEYAMAEAKK